MISSRYEPSWQGLRVRDAGNLWGVNCASGRRRSAGTARFAAQLCQSGYDPGGHPDDDRKTGFILDRQEAVANWLPCKPDQSGQDQAQNSKRIEEMSGPKRVTDTGLNCQEKHDDSDRDSGDQGLPPDHGALTSSRLINPSNHGGTGLARVSGGLTASRRQGIMFAKIA
jgi:hypothetical protein